MVLRTSESDLFPLGRVGELRTGGFVGIAGTLREYSTHRQTDPARAG
jgi:hypothetical protein